MEEAQSDVQQFLEECQADLEQVRKEIKEVKVLIEQSTTEVDRLARRNAEIANRLRQIESNFDTVPRQDIRSVYQAMIKGQGRLFTMRGQLEKMQEKLDSLKWRETMLTRIVNVLEQFEPVTVQAPEEEGEMTPAQSMIVRVIEAQENERQRLARQMHDGPAQLLTNLILQAEICRRLFDTDPDQARVELENLKAEVNKTFQQTRAFIADLRPMMLDDLGLVPTLKRYVNTWSEKHGIDAELTFVGREHRLPSYTEVTIFRAIQELMDNAAQHANPSRVHVTLEMDGRMARATVEDDGSGFDVDEVMTHARERRTIGIASIMDRVQMLGGSLRFESVLGRGTKAILEIPES